MRLSFDPQPQASPAWHAESAAAVLEALEARAEGLSPQEADERLARHGPNALPPAAKQSALSRLLAQFDNLLIYVLLAAAAVTALLAHWLDAAVILAVVVVNAAVGFVQEGRAQQALAALTDMIAPRAVVLRGGVRQAVEAAALAPGDIVLIEAGDRVPADLRLLEARGLAIDEALLTGESVAAVKSPMPCAPGAELAERTSMAFSGAMVTTGAGRGVVVATGASTEIGRIGRLLRDVQSLETPLVRQMEGFTRKLTVIVLTVSALVLLFAVGLRGYAWADAFLVVVGLAVAAMPEGLPAVITITLAVGVQRMARRSAIVRRLPAVETLGSVSVVCSDKTGTLTKNEMTVQHVSTAGGRFTITGAGYAPEGAIVSEGGAAIPADTHTGLVQLLETGALCSDAELRLHCGAWLVQGDPMDGALLVLARKGGLEPQRLLEERSRLDAIPFDAANRFMATLHAHPEGRVLHLKGAPEQILAMCSHASGPHGPLPLDHKAVLAEVDALAAQGLRVLALARKGWDAGALTLPAASVGCTFLGLAGFIDPPRMEARDAVAACRSAGVAVKMITGDHPVTAAAIARQVGLAEDPQVVLGSDIEAASEAELPALAARAEVVARASPEHKLRLVEALQARGAIVAMTGDGVNDAPALKRADIGVAMGRRGSETAKEAAEMVLADDNFASIVAAVREGRTVNDNVRKVIGWTLPTNGGEAMTIIAAILLGLTLPLTAIQILWVNMVTEVTLGLALAFEPAEPNVMRRPPRPAEAPLLPRFLVWRVALVSALFAMGVLGMFAWAQSRGLGLEASRTLAVNTLVVLQIFYLFNVRFLHGPSLTLRGAAGAPAVLLGVAATVAAQLLFTYAPFMQAVFNTRPLALLDGLAVLAAGAALLAILELDKAVFNQRTQRTRFTR